MALWTNMYVHPSQELGEQVLVFNVAYPIVCHLFCYCLRSDTDYF